MKKSHFVPGAKESLLGLCLAFAGITFFDQFQPSISPSLGATYLSYLVVWLPLVGAIAWSFCFRGRSAVEAFGWGFKPYDLLLGVAAALFLKCVSIFLELALLGHPATPYRLPIEALFNPKIVIITLIIPVFLAPLIEELFFRGILLRSISAQIQHQGITQNVAAFLAVLCSSTMFGLFHILSIPLGRYIFLVFLTTFMLGLATGALVVATGRLGGALVAHMSSNAITLFSAGILWN